MKTIELKDLYLTDFNMQQMFAMNQRWGNGRIFSRKKGRDTSALLYLKDARTEYILENGEKREFSKGSIVYIPQGSIYSNRFFACEQTHACTQLIEFELLDCSGEPFICCDEISVVSIDENGYFADLFDEAILTCKNSGFSYSEFKSVLYTLFAKIAKHHQQQNIYSKEFYSIAPAINYLMKDPCTDKSVAELAGMCHVSESCFRYLFKKYSGKTPSDYCLDKRIKRAKKLLQSDMYSVSETAQMLGYSDPGYFSKVFKKATGLSPKDYIDRK